MVPGLGETVGEPAPFAGAPAVCLSLPLVRSDLTDALADVQNKDFAVLFAGNNGNVCG